MNAIDKTAALPTTTFFLTFDEAVRVAGLRKEREAFEESVVDYLDYCSGGDDDETDEDREARLDKEQARLERRFCEHVADVLTFKVDRNAGVSTYYANLDGTFGVEITNPNRLFRTIINGVGLCHVGDDDFTDAETAKAHAAWLTSFYEVFGDRKPSFDLDL